MKKAVLLLMLLGTFGMTNAQGTLVKTTADLASLDYIIGSPVYLGTVGGLKIFSASFHGTTYYQNAKKRCKKGVGCCKSGKLTFDENHEIQSVDAIVGTTCGVGDSAIGQMYYQGDETWIKPD